jgi:hypothetical protein
MLLSHSAAVNAYVSAVLRAQLQAVVQQQEFLMCS